MTNTKETGLKVDGLPARDWGRQLIRLNHKHRNGIPRHGVAKLTNVENKKSILCVVLGQDNQDTISMDYDIRTELDLAKEVMFKFELKKVGWVGRLCWYLTAPDPAIKIPAWLAFWSVLLGAGGIILGIVSLCATG